SLSTNSANKTFFKHVYVLGPGSQVTVRAKGLQIQTHWSAENIIDVRYKTKAEYSEHLRSLLEEAVAARIRTTYPVAAHISGGLDSSSIAILANRQLRQQSRGLDTAYTWSPAKSDAYPTIKK